MASLDILGFNPFNLKNKIIKIEEKKMFCDQSKILKNVSWPINICLKYFMTPTKTIRPPSYILNVRSLNSTYGKTNFRVSIKVTEKHISGFLGSWGKYQLQFRAFRVRETYLNSFRVHKIPCFCKTN